METTASEKGARLAAEYVGSAEVALEQELGQELEQEMTSSSVTLLDSPAALAEFFAASEPEVQGQLVGSAAPVAVAAPEPKRVVPDSPMSMSQLVREQASKIRELELVNVELVSEIDRISRTKDQLISALQSEVQKWRAEARDKDLRVSAIQGKADQMDLFQMEHEAVKREAEDLRFERDGLLVRLEKSTSDAANTRNELRNVKLELNTSTLEIGRLKLELESSSSEVTNLKPAVEGASSEKLLLHDQLQRERQAAAEQASRLSRALDDVAQAQLREAAMQAEISSLRRRVGDLEMAERELNAARRAAADEAREVAAENSYLRSLAAGAGAGAAVGRSRVNPYSQENFSVTPAAPLAQASPQAPESRPPPAVVDENKPRNFPFPASSAPSAAARLLSAATIQGPPKSLLPVHTQVQANSSVLAAASPSGRGGSQAQVKVVQAHVQVQPPSPQHRKTKPLPWDAEVPLQPQPPHQQHSQQQHSQQQQQQQQQQPQPLADFARVSGPPATFTIAPGPAPLPAPPSKQQQQQQQQTPSAAPFATEASSAALAQVYEAAEKKLTGLISEKTSLREEGARSVHLPNRVCPRLDLWKLYLYAHAHFSPRPPPPVLGCTSAAARH